MNGEWEHRIPTAAHPSLYVGPPNLRAQLWPLLPPTHSSPATLPCNHSPVPQPLLPVQLHLLSTAHPFALAGLLLVGLSCLIPTDGALEILRDEVYMEGG